MGQPTKPLPATLPPVTLPPTALPPATLPLGDLLVSLGVLALGGFFAYGAFQINVTQSYARVGPRFFPFLVAAGLLVCGALLLVQALRGRAADPEGGEDVDADAPTDWRAVALVAVGLVGTALLMERLGFPLTAGLLFWAVAFAFGSRSPFAPVYGLALAFVVYLAFTLLLDLNLPAGVLGPLGL